MRGAGPKETSRSNFVADFAAKRAAQIERAKQIREERMPKPQTPPVEGRRSPRGVEPAPREYEQEPHGEGNSHRSGGSSHHGRGGSRPNEVLVTEGDFRLAVQRGIITPDQARQLWGVLSDPGTSAKVQSFAEENSNFDTQYNPTRYAEHTTCEPPRRSDQPPDRPMVRNEERQPSSASAKSRKPQWNDDTAFQPSHSEPQVPINTHDVTKKVTSSSRSRALPEWNGDFVDSGIPSQPPQVSKPRKEIPKKTENKVPIDKKSHVDHKRSAVHTERARSPDLARGDQCEDEVAEFERLKNEQRLQFEAALDEAEMNPQHMASCRICGRTFREDIIDRHEGACAKSTKKRKPYDTMKARIQDIDGAADVLRQAKRNVNKPPPQKPDLPTKIPKWKLQHQQFQMVLKSVHTGGTSASGPPPPMPEELDDRVPCPHCGRKFAHDTAQRHIPKCATTINKPKSLARPTRR